MEGELQFAAKFFAVGEVELVFLDEELAVHFVGGVFDKQFVLVPSQDDADGRVVAFGVFLGGKVAEIHVHLPDVVVLDFVDFQINEDEAAEDAVVEDEVHPVVGVVERNPVLTTDEGEAFAEFEQEGLEVVAEAGFEVGLGDVVWLGDFKELKDVGVAQEIGGRSDDLALGSKLEDGVLVFSGGEAEEEGGFLLALQLTDGPFFPEGLLLVKAAFQRIVDLQKFDNVRPAQLVRQRRTFWVGEVKLANANHIAAAETLTVAESKIKAEAGEQAGAVVGPGFAALLKFHDVTANLPISFGDVGVDGLRRPRLTGGVNLGDFSQQALVAVICGEVAAAHALFSMVVSLGARPTSVCRRRSQKPRLASAFLFFARNQRQTGICVL